MFYRTKWNALTCFDLSKTKTRGNLSIFLSWLSTNVSILNLSLFKHGNSLSAYNYNIPGNKKEYNISYHYFFTKICSSSYKPFSLRKQPTFGEATTGFPAKWRLRNERRNSILRTRLYPDMGSASDWSCRVANLIQPIRSTTQIWVMTRYQYGISALVSQTSFCGKMSCSFAKRRLFSKAISP